MSQPEYVALAAMYNSRAARLGEIQVLRHDAGTPPQPIVRYFATSGQDPRDVLAEHGWTVTGQNAVATGPEAPMNAYSIKAHDWPRVIATLTALKAAAEQEAAARTAAWQATIRDSRGPMREIAAAAGVTDKRVYQIRKGTPEPSSATDPAPSR